MAVLSSITCYFDESNSDDLQINVVAGYLAPVEVWDKLFTPAWNDVLYDPEWPSKIIEFKAADCASGRGEFDGWPREARDSLVIRLVSVLKQTPLYAGIGTAFFWPGKADPSGSKKQVRLWRRLMERRGYGMCVGMCLLDAFGLMHKYDQHRERVDSIKPVLDEKNNFAEVVVKNFSLARRNLPPEFAERIEFPVGGRSLQLAPLQAADLLAYEIMKEVANRCPPVRSARKSLVEMVSARTPYAARIFEAPPLPVYQIYQALKRRWKPTLHVLIEPNRPIRSPDTWGID